MGWLDVDKEQFVDQYLSALDRANEIPNSYCTKVYLMVNSTLRPFQDESGFIGFKDRPNTIFFIPPYRMEAGEPVFYKGLAKNSFPTAINQGKYRRKDVNYFFSRENSISIMSTDLAIRTELKKEGIRCYPLPMSDHSKNKLLRKFYKRAQANKKTPIYKFPDHKLRKKFIFKDFGQHRFVLEFENEILGLIVWSEGSVYPTVHVFQGLTSSRRYTKPCGTNAPALSYTAHLVALFFMRSFPEGTYFNFGGCGASEILKRWMLYTYPAKILEITTAEKYPFANKKAKLKPVGKLVWEDWIPGRGLAMVNRMLFFPVWKLVEARDPRVHSKVSEYIRKRLSNNKATVSALRREAREIKALEYDLTVKMFKMRNHKDVLLTENTSEDH